MDGISLASLLLTSLPMLLGLTLLLVGLLILRSRERKRRRRMIGSETRYTGVGSSTGWVHTRGDTHE